MEPVAVPQVVGLIELVLPITGTAFTETVAEPASEVQPFKVTVTV